MKKIYKYLLMTVLASGTLFYSCETVELENLVDPNALSPEQADANNLLNNIQLSYAGAQATFNNRAAELTRIDYMFGRDYFDNYGSGTMNGVWGALYSSMLPDIAVLEALNADENIDLNFQLGMAKTMQAHVMMQLVDFLGDIVWSEANNPLEFPSPALDDDATVYTAALDVLASAASNLAAAEALDPDSSDKPSEVTDLFHAEAGDEIAKWIKINNTIAMRANLTLGNYAAVLNATNVISNADEDFEFPYDTNELQPDNRHPDYAADYTDSGANIYQSNWMMNLMDVNNDPRIRYYFYRQDPCTPGASCDPDGDGETLQCSLQTPPAHYSGYTYCYLENGYWGRDHGNDEGTPPDNFTRTAVGVYPAAGRFDDDAFSNVGLGVGAGGAGIEPIYLSSYVDFMKAEAALASNMPASAASYLESAMTKSIEKVQSFGAKDASADLSFEPSAGAVASYVSGVVANFNGATGDDQWNILAEQYWIALFGGSGDAYNFYRRTGYPTTVQPNLELNPGVFPRTFLYPNSEVIANPNVLQRTDNATQVFWDTKPAGPAFPPAN